MKYMGSKNRIVNDILPIILKDRTCEQYYVEPFCGGLNSIDKVKGNRIASDKNKYLIAMWKGLQENNPRPYDISKELYSIARNEYRNNTNDELDDFLIGWIGFMASFNGRFFDGGYSGLSSGRNYIDEQIRNTEKQIPFIKDIEFNCCSYDELYIPSNSIIYCDIPYKDTKQYDISKNFDYSKFWNWCRNISEKHQVYISEYNAPDDFKCVWEKELVNSMNQKNTHRPIEKLFTFS